MDIVPTHPMKRLFDVCVSLLLLALLSPIIFLFLVLIFLEHCIRLRPLDPLLYSEIRWSGGTQFALYKFNIFRQDVIDAMRAKNELSIQRPSSATAHSCMWDGYSSKYTSMNYHNYGMCLLAT